MKHCMQCLYICMQCFYHFFNIKRNYFFFEELFTRAASYFLPLNSQ